MARAGSNPFSTMAGIGTGQTGQIIPLKTRVVQLLALGPLSVDEIVRRVGMSDVEVMRVVKVVCSTRPRNDPSHHHRSVERRLPEHTPSYRQNTPKSKSPHGSIPMLKKCW